MHHHFHWSLHDIWELQPWQKKVHLLFIEDEIRKEEERIKNMNK